MRRTDAGGEVFGSEGVGAGADEPAALTQPLQVAAPSREHWVLIGSLLEDLRRIHDALQEPAA